LILTLQAGNVKCREINVCDAIIKNNNYTWNMVIYEKNQVLCEKIMPLN
jgi:hypothetical protein